MKIQDYETILSALANLEEATTSMVVYPTTKKLWGRTVREDALPVTAVGAEALCYFSAFVRHVASIIRYDISKTPQLKNYSDAKRLSDRMNDDVQRFCAYAFTCLYPNVEDKYYWAKRTWVTEDITAAKGARVTARRYIQTSLPITSGDADCLESVMLNKLTPLFEVLLPLVTNPDELAKAASIQDKPIDVNWLSVVKASIKDNQRACLPHVYAKLPMAMRDYYAAALTPKDTLAAIPKHTVFTMGNIISISTASMASTQELVEGETYLCIS